MFRVALLIDGGHLRVLCRLAHLPYNPDFVEQIAHACVAADERLLRVLYYDCAPFNGEVALPVSGGSKVFEKPDTWLQRLAKKDYFAVRRGVLKFRGWKPKVIPTGENQPLTDNDFNPDFEQKGVDMRIGLDVATFSETRAVDRLLLITNDTDCAPAMKHARKAGLQTAIIRFPGSTPASELQYHSDFQREVAWPQND
jgi:uncharacterized LabA/DUF88 family protein